MRQMTLAGRRIADNEPCYVIAELGHNHGGSVVTARQMIASAAVCGAHAVKLQKRDNATLYTPAMLNRPYDHPFSYGPTYGAHRAALEFGEAEYQQCLIESQLNHVMLFATAFDEPSADFLVQVGVHAIKIHSGGLTDGPLLRHVASLGLPIVLSTGGSTEAEIDVAINQLEDCAVAVLHCTAAYPVTNYVEHNLRCIERLCARYPDRVIGWSGHDSGIAMAVAAYALGARIIEMHFTLNRAMRGTDHGWSLEPVGFRKLCRDLTRAHQAMGDGVKRVYQSEYAPIQKMRRTQDVHDQWQIRMPDERCWDTHSTLLRPLEDRRCL